MRVRIFWRDSDQPHRLVFASHVASSTHPLAGVVKSANADSPMGRTEHEVPERQERFWNGEMDSKVRSTVVIGLGQERAWRGLTRHEVAVPTVPAGPDRRDRRLKQ